MICSLQMTPATFSSVAHDHHSSSRPESNFLAPRPAPHRPNWRSRIFAPLTPILASPITTPTHSLSAQTISLNSDTEEDTPPSQDVERTSTSTVPTPTWTSTPPTPPPNLIFRSKSVSVRPMSSFVSPSTSLPDATMMRRSVLSASVEKKRSASLPPMTILKPCPPTRSSSRPTSHSSHKFTSDSVSHPLSQQSTEKLAFTVTPRAMPVFHLAIDNSDREDDSHPEKLSNTDSSEPESAVQVVAIIPQLPLIRKSLSIAERDSSRRYHAFLELLSTELGYLLDLRTLVSVYLRLLPVLTKRNSSSAAHGSSSNPSLVHSSRSSVIHSSHTLSASHRTQSHPHLNGSIHPPIQPEAQVTTYASMYSLHGRGDRSAIRHLFSASDLDTITRNAEEILEFHETLVRRLRDVVSPFGFPMTLGEFENHAENSGQSHRRSPEDVHRAINAVCTVFIEHASSFDQYQSFCSGHSEAFDLVRKVQQRYPTEWDAFEQRCVVVAAEMSLDASLRILHEEALEEEVDSSVPQAKRRHSLSSLDALSNGNLKAPNLTASESGHSDRETSRRRPRLMFMDYLIKPVQRVCRYPLLFDQLQERIASQRSSQGSDDSSSTPSETDQEVVKTALRTMRMVANSVDEARRRQDLSAKSVQIVSRITQGLLTSTVSHSRLPQSSSLSTFLSSLPPCCLSGSLDVIHYRGMNVERLGTVKAKYLGGFLFPGGFLVLVKVAKSRTYEPKHWFNLRGFELTDSNDDDGLLPSWFRLSSKGQRFEFAASCRREKDVWVDAIRSAITEEVPWSDEPPTSLQTMFGAEGSGLLLEDVPFDTMNPLPTIQSIPELDNVESTVQVVGETAPPSVPSLGHRPSQINHCAEHPTKAETMPVVGPSRRSSVAAQSIPTSESSTFHLVRSTASAREQVDRGLLDVFSEKCLTARFHAHTHEEELFEAQNVTRSFPRSSSGLNMASAMGVAAKNRLTKRESVLVPRRKSFMDVYGTSNDPENYTHLAMPNRMARQRPPNKLRIVAVSKETSNEGDEDANELYVESPSPMSHCSSVSFATPVTPLTLSAPLSAPLPTTDGGTSRSEFLDVRPKKSVPKRSKSMVENFRGLFVPRPASPTTTLTRESSARSSVSNSGLLRWWSRESLRRRVRSAPDVPCEELPSALTTQSLNVSAAPRPSLAITDRPYSQSDLQFLAPPSEFGVEEPTPRKKGVSSSHGARRRWTSSALSSAARDEGSIPTRARIRRNLSFLNRFTPITPGTVSQHSES